MKRKKFCLIFSFILLILLSSSLMAGHKKINGWEWIEMQGTVELWQKRNSSLISEATINVRPALMNEIARGYSIRFINEEDLPDYYFYNYPLSIWKIYYYGQDLNGNVYLKIHTIKDGLSKNQILNIMTIIEEISNKLGEENQNNTSEDLLKKRLAFFNEKLAQYLDKEGEIIIVDSSKAVVINNIEEIPALNLIINDASSVLNVHIGLNG
ncbi:MAG: hypothetical protein ACOCQA_03195 [bacterium]